MEPNNWPKCQGHQNKIHTADFYQALIQQFKNKERSNEIIQANTHIGSITPTWTTPFKSAKSPPTKQLLYKSPIRPPKTLKDRLKNVSIIKPAQLKQKNTSSDWPGRKIQKNSKVNNERPGSAFKLPTTKFHTVPTKWRTKSPIRMNKQCND